MIAKTETTTLWIRRLVDASFSLDGPEGWPEMGTYQLQAFKAETTGFMLAVWEGREGKSDLVEGFVDG